MSNTVVITKDEYTRQSLQQLGLKRSDSSMQHPRATWGTNVHITSTDGDSFQITERAIFKVAKKVREDFVVSDGDEKTYGITLFDLELDKTALEEDDWRRYANNKSPLKYSEIRPLIPGEYEYQNAIVGVQMAIPPVEGRFGIDGSTLHIDVPDAVEKGTVNVTSAGVTTIKFSKRFYVTPKILSNVVSSNDGTAAIEITEISREGFKIGLKSLTNPGIYVNGTIDWLAEGY